MSFISPGVSGISWCPLFFFPIHIVTTYFSFSPDEQSAVVFFPTFPMLIPIFHVLVCFLFLALRLTPEVFLSFCSFDVG